MVLLSLPTNPEIKSDEKATPGTRVRKRRESQASWSAAAHHLKHVVAPALCWHVCRARYSVLCDDVKHLIREIWDVVTKRTISGSTRHSQGGHKAKGCVRSPPPPVSSRPSRRLKVLVKPAAAS